MTDQVVERMTDEKLIKEYSARPSLHEGLAVLLRQKREDGSFAYSDSEAVGTILLAFDIIAKREREKVLREMLEPSEAIIEAGAEGYHEAKDAKRKAYNARHAYRIERGDSVPIFSACPADWLEETWQAMLRAFARAQGLEL